jgi:hypothetical protein
MGRILLKRLAFITLTVLLALTAGCSGALTPTLTPTIAITVPPAPTPLPRPTSPQCNNLAGAEKVARDFIGRYNAADTDGVLSFVGDNVRRYIDGTMGFNLTAQPKTALIPYLKEQFRKKDRFEIGELTSRVNPSNLPPTYGLNLTVSRSVDNAIQKGTIEMGIECATNQIIIVAIITTN